MNGLPYYKRYPRDFIEGTIGMSLELKGAYALVLDLIYMQSGRLPDDARYISGLLGCTVRKWKSIRFELLNANKVYVNGEFLSNYRADNLLETSRKLQENQAEKASGPKKNNNLGEATAKPFARLKPEPKPDTEEKKEPSGSFQKAALSKADLDLIEGKCREAAGAERNPSPKLFSLAPILSCLNSGADFDLDVLPTIRTLAARQKREIRTWDYFTEAIMDAHASRTTERVGNPARGSPSKPMSASQFAKLHSQDATDDDRSENTIEGNIRLIGSIPSSNSGRC